MKPTLAVSLISFAVAATSAFAGGPTTVPAEPAPIAPAPASRPSQDWTGFYLGGQIGQISTDFLSVPGRKISEATDGTYGLHAGYNHDFGSWVIGAEFDYDSFDQTIYLPTVIGPRPIAAVTSISRLKLRGGFDLGSVLAYGTIGVASIKTDLEPYDDTLVLGAGISWMMSQNWIAGAEVLTQNFEASDGTSNDIETTTATLRLSYKF